MTKSDGEVVNGGKLYIKWLKCINGSVGMSKGSGYDSRGSGKVNV
ncbi:MAG TPA: hypothetical protein PLR52_05295 [Bacteroidales bacterium]|nr:hypothetical protein [Bacteroidales bacterium]HPI69300.1 hypothetical protein [Bacteroidales bacterium]HPR72844.1 hypothetical protein [Bacteroidales bacterium]